MIAEYSPHLEAATQTLYEANADEATKRKCRARRDYYKQVNATEKLLHDLKVEKEALTKEIVSLETTLAERQTSLAEREIALAEKDSAIEDLQEYIKQLEQQIKNQ